MAWKIVEGGRIVGIWGGLGGGLGGWGMGGEGDGMDG